jgi:hypothetical protein
VPDDQTPLKSCGTESRNVFRAPYFSSLDEDTTALWCSFVNGTKFRNKDLRPRQAVNSTSHHGELGPFVECLFPFSDSFREPHVFQDYRDFKEKFGSRAFRAT